MPNLDEGKQPTFSPLVESIIDEPKKKGSRILGSGGRKNISIRKAGQKEGEVEEKEKEKSTPTLQRPFLTASTLMIRKRRQDGGVDTFKLFYKNSNGKYSSKRFSVEDISLGEFKPMAINVLSLKNGEFRFYTVPNNQSMLQLQVDNITLKSGTTVMIEAQKRQGHALVGCGYLVSFKKKYILVSTKPVEKDPSAQFVVQMKGTVLCLMCVMCVLYDV